MKNVIKILAIFLLFAGYAQSQWITLDSIRVQDANGVPLLLNQVVTTRGVVTTSQEFGGVISYFQSNTAGLVCYDTSVTHNVLRGDSIQVTGTLTQYNGLSELTPVTQYTVFAHNKTVAPKVVTPSIIRNPTGEQYEGMLIKIAGVTQIKTTAGVVATQWTVTGTGTNYRLFVGSDSCDIRIYGSSNIANTTIPPYPFTIVAEQSQFKSTSPYNSGYQILPRALTDIIVTDVKRISSEVPANYILHQSYPNPFNPTTKIRYEVAKTSLVILKVYDITGKEVSTLVNNGLTPGTYETTFTGENLASGVYFYTLFADGAKVDSKKMILNK